MSPAKGSVTPIDLRRLYEEGVNISRYLRNDRDLPSNSPEVIEIAYDLQTGSYVDEMRDASVRERQRRYGLEIATTILGLCEPKSILEAGVGEATTFSAVLSNLDSGILAFGFDISWSRIAYAKRWLAGSVAREVTLCTGDLPNMPFADNSVDVVYTSHSVEPNGGNEQAILAELYRVTGRFLVLLEPAYELANQAAREWMESHGYCRNLPGIAESLGMQVLKHEIFAGASHPLNPTAITVIQKRSTPVAFSHILACPKYKSPLELVDGALYSRDALAVYPVLGGIPCLRVQNAILASKFKEVAQH